MMNVAKDARCLSKILAPHGKFIILTSSDPGLEAALCPKPVIVRLLDAVDGQEARSLDHGRERDFQKGAVRDEGDGQPQPTVGRSGRRC